MAKVSLSEVWGQFQTWIARRDNPHEVTAEQVGAYNKTEVDNLISTYLPAGLLPISTFGAQLKTDGGIYFSSQQSTFLVTLSPAAMSLLLAGTPYRFKEDKYSFTIEPNSVSYLYVNRDPSAGYESAYLEVVSGKRPDKPQSFLITTITRGDDSSDAVADPGATFICMVDVYRITNDTAN